MLLRLHKANAHIVTRNILLQFDSVLLFKIIYIVLHYEIVIFLSSHWSKLYDNSNDSDRSMFNSQYYILMCLSTYITTISDHWNTYFCSHDFSRNYIYGLAIHNDNTNQQVLVLTMYELEVTIISIHIGIPMSSHIHLLISNLYFSYTINKRNRKLIITNEGVMPTITVKCCLK